MKKERVDVLLVARGLVESRARAQALVMAGRVFSGEQRVDKAGTTLPLDAPLTVRGDDNPYVSRGGLKLAGALAAFAPSGLAVQGKVAVDVGASTGGFTDCLLQAGAARVYAVDVGWGQLHPKLRSDPRVVVMERTNARTLTAASFPEPLGLAVVDASFIGLGALAPALAAMLPPGGELCAMVKPQFEAGRDEVRRGRGVIRDEAVRRAAIERATDALAAQGFVAVASCDAPLAGPRGNLEHFVYARRLFDPDLADGDVAVAVEVTLVTERHEVHVGHAVDGPGQREFEIVQVASRRLLDAIERVAAAIHQHQARGEHAIPRRELRRAVAQHGHPAHAAGRPQR